MQFKARTLVTFTNPLDGETVEATVVSDDGDLVSIQIVPGAPPAVVDREHLTRRKVA